MCEEWEGGSQAGGQWVGRQAGRSACRQVGRQVGGGFFMRVQQKGVIAVIGGLKHLPWVLVILPVAMGSWQHAVGDAFNALIVGSVGRRAPQPAQGQGRGASSDSWGRGGSSESLSGAEPSSGSGRDAAASLRSSHSGRLRRRSVFSWRNNKSSETRRGSFAKLSLKSVV